MTGRFSQFKMGALFWVLLVLVLGLIAYVALRGCWAIPSILDQERAPRLVSSAVPVIPAPPIVQEKGDGMYSDGDLDPLFKALQTEGLDHVAGVWLSGVTTPLPNQAMAYLQRLMLMRTVPATYLCRGGMLMVIEKSPLSFDEIVGVVAHLGRVEEKSEKDHLIEVCVNRELLGAAPSPSILTDSANPHYLENNIRELSSLDVGRMTASAKRLVRVTPPTDEVRARVSTQLIHLLNDPWGNDGDYVQSLAAALAVWAPRDDEAARRCMEMVLDGLAGAHLNIPFPCMDFMVEGDFNRARKVLLPLWLSEPEKWEKYCLSLGGGIEGDVVAALSSDQSPEALRRSAVRVLAGIGGECSLPVLRALMNDRDNSLSVFAGLAVKEIESRAKGKDNVKDNGKEGEQN
ncbi:MAG: hypothetical protein RSB24_08195 [Akkermansia sp.]